MEMLHCQTERDTMTVYHGIKLTSLSHGAG